MKIFEDVVSGDELMSDIFPFTLDYEDVIMKVPSAYKNADQVGQIDIGCGNEFGNPDAEEGGNEEAAAEKVIDVVYNSSLTQLQLSKKELMVYIKKYFGKLVKYLETNNPSRVDIFKKNAQAFVKEMVSKFDDLEIYAGKNYNDEEESTQGMVVFSYWEDESAKGPVFYFFKDGLKEVKC